MTSKQLIGGLLIVLFVLFGTAAMRPPQNKRNLKVLPPDISDQTLDSFMHSYTKALNVNCVFCHSSYKNFPDSINFEADDNPMKDQARKMMRLTIQINKDYFYYDTAKQPEYLNVVRCITCHRGDPMPADLK